MTNHNELVQLLKKINTEFEINNIITLKRVEVFTLILMMFFNMLDR